MRVLVCGSRAWDNQTLVWVLLNGLACRYNALTVIEGGALGADRSGARWCEQHPDAGHLTFEADWDTHGKRAGLIRNQQMLDEGKPDVVLAFTDDLSKSKGTADMVRRARAVGVPVYVIGRAR